MNLSEKLLLQWWCTLYEKGLIVPRIKVSNAYREEIERVYLYTREKLGKDEN